MDSKFVDGLQEFVNNNENSKYLIPIRSQINVHLEKARRNIKRRILYTEQNQSRNEAQNSAQNSVQNSAQNSAQIETQNDLNNSEEVIQETPLFDLDLNREEIDIVENEGIEPKAGDYWSIKSDKDSFVIIENENPLAVQYFQRTDTERYHRFNPKIWEILVKELSEKITAPKIVTASKVRQYYDFKKST